ncbi:hypothetical protein ACIQW5_11230 [Methylorubrum thiocyanatum]|uniref:hypothetical protein n=1 Tax=Methylorubrum thiocyanatum TaxID=47958 RepID=UPI00383AADCC
MSKLDQTNVVITAQTAQNETYYVTQTSYTFKNMDELFEDYQRVENDRLTGIISNRVAGAFKANITRRMSYEAYLLVCRVPAWTLMNRLKPAHNDPSLYEKPMKLALRLGVLADRGAVHVQKPTPAQMNARLLQRPDPKKGVKRRITGKLTARIRAAEAEAQGPQPVPASNVVALPIKRPSSVAASTKRPTQDAKISMRSESRSAAAHKAWRTRRANMMASTGRMGQ